MRKDLWIGAMTAMVVHSGVVLYSFLQPLRQIHRSAPEPVATVAELAPPPPPEMETVEEPAEAPAKPDRPPPPSLIDAPTLDSKSPFVEPIHPTPPSGDTRPVSVLPDGISSRWAAGPGIFEPIDLSQAPIATATPHPQYPYAMRQAGIEGEAVVDFIVDEHGNVLRPYAVRGAQAEFGRAAVEGLRHWRFRPGMKDGKPVKVHMQIPIEFSLQK